MDWTSSERRILRSLSTPEKIQEFIDRLDYNPEDSSTSPRVTLKRRMGHCLDGGLLACAALEFHGERPLMVDLVAHRDDHHVLAVYRGKKGWGSIAKSNTALLRGRTPVYRSVRELVLSYFDFYFNTKGQYSLQSYSAPINLNRYNAQEWRTTSADLMELGMSFSDLPHFDLLTERELERLPKAPKHVLSACFLGANPAGLYKA
jgi:hypothetical protein